jgi:MOSC domain-containing protein YiiM
VNVGPVRTVEWRGENVTTGIWKSPVTGRVTLRGVNLVGDDQADRTVHGGPDKAVYAYAAEDYALWTKTGVTVAAGTFGENLMTEGIDLARVVAGERWRIGTTLLEVAQPRLPCFKLGIRMADPSFPRKFMLAGRMGAYLRIVTEGDVGAGDSITVVQVPAHRVTLGDMRDALENEEKALRLREIANLPSFWRKQARS